MNNKVPQVTYIYNRYKKASPTIAASIEMRITYDKKQKYISTGISVYSNQWKGNRIINRPDAIQLNNILDSLLIETRQIIMEMVNERNIDIYSIPHRLDLKRKKATNFIMFCEQRAEVKKYGIVPDSQKRYDRFLKYFREWGKIIEFSDITEANIIAYDKYLKTRNLGTYSKWNNYHRFLNSFISDAIDEGLIQRNPYKWINIEVGKNTKGILKSLTPLEFKRIKSAIMITESLERIRDLFIFQTYTCLSYSDLKEFNPKKIQTVKGMKVYTGSRKKTHKNYTIPLLPQAIKILNKYNNRLPVISNVNYNQYLKIVAQAAGIDKPISSHWARHTGATMLLNEGVDMNIIAKICGHASTKITEQIYAKVLDETVVDALSKVNI